MHLFVIYHLTLTLTHRFVLDFSWEYMLGVCACVCKWVTDVIIQAAKTGAYGLSWDDRGPLPLPARLTVAHVHGCTRKIKRMIRLRCTCEQTANVCEGQISPPHATRQMTCRCNRRTFPHSHTLTASRCKCPATRGSDGRKWFKIDGRGEGGKKKKKWRKS